MALPEVKNLKNARYLIGYKATQKSMRPDCIQDLSSLNGTGPVERLGTNNGKKKKRIIKFTCTYVLAREVEYKECASLLGARFFTTQSAHVKRVTIAES